MALCVKNTVWGEGRKEEAIAHPTAMRSDRFFSQPGSTSKRASRFWELMDKKPHPVGFAIYKKCLTQRRSVASATSLLMKQGMMV